MQTQTQIQGEVSRLAPSRDGSVVQLEIVREVGRGVRSFVVTAAASLIPDDVVAGSYVYADASAAIPAASIDASGEIVLDVSFIATSIESELSA